ncbi:MAG TPA: hypothetical protein DCE13_03765, partial [Cryomorphaceae bacterium]|nr:hypothetical protein [Cryomorphaceae bacterium]
CKTVTIRGIGLEEGALPQWQLYPNPTSGALTLQLPYGMDAKKVMLRASNALGQSLNLDWQIMDQRLTTQLPAQSGVYLMELLDRTSGESLGIKRVVVE